MAKIIILDDYASIRYLLAEEVAAEGNEVRSVSQPELVLQEVSSFQPHLAILDLFIGGQYRWDLLERMKEQNPDLPIIIFSGYYPKGDPHLDQIDGYINKSCVLDELKNRIREILLEHRPRPRDPDRTNTFCPAC